VPHMLKTSAAPDITSGEHQPVTKRVPSRVADRQFVGFSADC
jgi:hypothetical protein